MTTLEARLKALEKRDDGLEILNPRWFDEPMTDSEIAEHERQNAERIAAAVKAGHKIIRIENPRNFAE